MLYRCLAAALAAIAIGAIHGGSVDAPAAPFHVGETTRTFHSQTERHWRRAHTQALIANIWYPVDISVSGVSYNVDAPDRLPFRMQPSTGKAPVASTQTQHLLLLLSYGMGSMASSLDWMVAALAANDYITTDVNRPGNMILEPLTRDGLMLWWECATDVSEVLNDVLTDPMLGAYVNRTCIGAVGFSLGGYTVLELASARTDVLAFMAFCGLPQVSTTYRPPGVVRTQINPTVDITRSSQTEAPLARSGASYHDTRIKAVFAMAPALGMATDVTSLGSISIPVSLTTGDVDITVPVDTSIRRIVKMLPRTDLLLMSGASHYTFMDMCLPGAVPHVPLLCKGNPDADYDAVHTEAARRALGFFGAALSGQV